MDEQGPDETLSSGSEDEEPETVASEKNPSSASSPDVPHIEGFDIAGRLGEGGMGVVWKAVQRSTHREVALKLMSGSLLGSQKVLQRFEREIELAAGLEHPHIARVYDSGLDKGIYYYAMELVDGLPLDRYVKEKQLGRREILQLMHKVCDAVRYAHQNGVIHRDLKPSNILVTEEGDPRVLDFGLAKPLEASDLSVDGDVLGTKSSAPPESTGNPALPGGA